MRTLVHNLASWAVRAWLTDAKPERIAPLRREAVAFASQHGMADAQLPDLAIALS